MKKFDLLEKLSFERVAGSQEEYRAMEVIKAEIETYDVQVEIEEFTIDFVEEVTATFEIPATQETFEVTGVGMGGTGEVEAAFLYIDALDPISLAQAKGKIVLFNGGITYASYKKLSKRKSQVLSHLMVIVMMNRRILKNDISVQNFKHWVKFLG